MATSKRSGRVCAGLFGWMHAGVGELVDVGPGRFTGLKYVEILEDVLLPTVRAMFVPDPDPFYLVHDNSPIHISLVVRRWFDEHPEITVLPHPPRSPDLNPIENVWRVMTRSIENPTRESVVIAAVEAWEGLRGAAGQQMVSNNVASMSRRLNAVLAVGGGYTKY